MSKANLGRPSSHTVIPEGAVSKLKSLTPQDSWLYAYAKLVFEARWNYYKSGKFIKPDRPPYPKVQCQSTRYILNCENGPYKKLVFSMPETPQEHKKLFSNLL